MSAFIGKFKEISSSNMVAIFKEHGKSDDEANSKASRSKALEFSEKDTIYTIKSHRGHFATVNQFQLGKGFDLSLPNGTTIKALVVAVDDNKLVLTMADNKETRVVYEIVGNELRVTTTAGPVVGVMTYARQ